MAGTYKPIAGLTPDNYGPVNTVVAIFLCSTTVLFSSIRFAIGRRRLLQLDTDDAAYYVALVCTARTSVALPALLTSISGSGDYSICSITGHSRSRVGETSRYAAT